MVEADLVPMLALMSIVYLAASMLAVANKRIDELDALFAITLTVIASLILIILSAKYDMLLYTWIGVGVLAALLAYGAVRAPKVNG